MSEFQEPTIYIYRKRNPSQRDLEYANGWNIGSDKSLYGKDNLDLEFYIVETKTRVYPEVTLSFKEAPKEEEASGQ